MSCNQNHSVCESKFNIKSFGTCDVSAIRLNGKDRTALNWSQISIPEVVSVPVQKPNIEHLDQVYVEATINCAKLIETPFAYKSYERQATSFEVSTALSALETAKHIELGPIAETIKTILATPGLPAIAAVAALQNAYNAVTTAQSSLSTAIAAAQSALARPCVAAAEVVAKLQPVLTALAVLAAALNALAAAATALASAVHLIPTVGPIIEKEVKTLLHAIEQALTGIERSVSALKNAIAVMGATNVLVLKANAEGTCLSGRKIVIDGILTQKIVYTGLVLSQTVHSFCNQIPFSAYIVPYANFVGLTYAENISVIADPTLPCETILVNGFAYDPKVALQVNVTEEFCVKSCIEDIFADAIDARNVFKNITLFLSAKPIVPCA